MLLILFFIFIVGLSIGSFLNCYLWRMHSNKKLSGRSMCPQCKNTIAWYDNIPVISFLILMAKCRHCKKPISWQYPIVELVTGLLFFLAFIFEIQKLTRAYTADVSAFVNLFLNYQLGLILVRDFFLIAVLIVIFIYDLKWYLILDRVTLPACVIIFALNLLTGSSWSSLVLSGIIGSSFFLIQFIVSNGKWIGGGDIRLGLLMGLALGWPNTLVALFIAYISGSIIGVGLLVWGKKKMDSAVPFGVFLTVGTLVAFFHGTAIVAWYLGLLY
ncbi:MAG: prepilin peptidase [Candidatus Falkowbacteria bacterium]|nr:prepilin peptidase [Candidatus Falkowbacteria bacterium]